MKKQLRHTMERWSWLGLLAASVCLPGCRPSGGPAAPPARAVEAMNRGVSLMGQYQYDPAVAAFQEALQAAPGLNEARINLAMAVFNRNRKEDQDLDRAGKLLEEVLQKEPANARALYFKAVVLQHIGKAEEATPCLEKVAQLQPRDGAVWYLLALCKQRLGRPCEAEFLRAVQERPYLYSAYYQLYQLALRAGQEAKANRFLEQFKKTRESPLGESIELPQYNQMGNLALTQPLPASIAPPVSSSRHQFKPAATLFTPPGAAARPSGAGRPLDGLSCGDLDKDGLPEVLFRLGAPGRLALLRQTAPGRFADATAGSGLEGVTNAWSCALGDYDNDDIPDALVATANGARLFRGRGGLVFAEAAPPAGLEAAARAHRTAMFLDADHDGDLDVYVCSAAEGPETTPNALWNNNGDGVFTNIALNTGVACADSRSVAVLPGDLDNDRDLDLVILRRGQPAKVFLNDLLGQYRDAGLDGLNIRGDLGGVLQDFNGDGELDLLALGGEPAEPRLWLGDGHGQLQPDASFAGVAAATRSWGALRGLRAADLDLDGDLDVMCFGAAAHALLNDGRGRFVLRSEVWKPAAGAAIEAAEVQDLTGDGVADLLMVEQGPSPRVALCAGDLQPASTALLIQPGGIRSQDGRTRSPASGYGVRITARAGLREQRLLYTGLAGGPCQSLLPAVLGLGGAPKADYAGLAWPDGVAQSEMALAAGQLHRIAELQRKISSCPVLFAWNGRRFEFVTDFAGVGGLGYFVSPGVSAPPQVCEHIKIEPDQLVARDGFYELRVTEPMEESAYIDRLELLAVDHPAGQPVFPDERLALSGPPPTHELLAVEKEIFPARALDPQGRDCAERLRRADRVYAFEPPLDRRYIGFCQPHALELDFEGRLSELARAGRVFLFIHGFIEYPYSQTVYAASQSRIGWQPIRVDRLEADGGWSAIVPDGGAPGGMARMMTIELTGKLTRHTRKLRLTTNLEIYYDQVFLARHDGGSQTTTRTVPLAEANLRRVGFAREYSPDGRLPLLYDYERADATASFHVLKGAYTRYGPVRELLERFDDRHVIMAPGDEIALKFDAASLPATPAGFRRSFVLISHAYCKDMDLYTATPNTLDPLPFRGMSRYPYAAPERYPAAPEQQAYLRAFNTRRIE